MIYINLECKPKWDSTNNFECGGAYINCWINVDTEAEALTVAQSVISNEGWDIKLIDEIYPIAVDDYKDGHSMEGLKSFNSALETGISITIHTFPNESEDNGVA